MIEQYTIKAIKQTEATDLTNSRMESISAIKKVEEGLELIGIATGMYGLNAKLLKGRKTNRLYKITARTPALYMIG